MVFLLAKNCIDLSPNGAQFSVLQENEISIYSTNNFEVIQKLNLNKILEGLHPLITHVKMFSESYVAVQTFDGALTFVNFHQSRIAYQKIDNDKKTILNNDIILVENNIFLNRKNEILELKRIVEE